MNEIETAVEAQTYDSSTVLIALILLILALLAKDKILGVVKYATRSRHGVTLLLTGALIGGSAFFFSTEIGSETYESICSNSELQKANHTLARDLGRNAEELLPYTTYGLVAILSAILAYSITSIAAKLNSNFKKANASCVKERLTILFAAKWPGRLGASSAVAALLALPFICNLEYFQNQEASSLLYLAPLFALPIPICIYSILSLRKGEELAEDLTANPITNALVFSFAPFSAFYLSALYVYLELFSENGGPFFLCMFGALSLIPSVFLITERHS